MSLFLHPGLVALTLGYVLSQFYRAFLAVLSSTLQAELGASAGDLAISSGMWFLSFAAVQVPVGWALDNIGPRRTAAVLLAVGGGGGAAIFALAGQVWHLHLAMALIGIGCAPALMAAYYILAHEFPPAVFAGMTGLVVGFGSLGDILGTAPLVALIHSAGWRNALWLLTGATLLVAGLQLGVVRDPTHAPGAPRGRIADVLRLRVLWLMLPLIAASYAASAATRGLWAAPYLRDVFGAGDAAIGQATMAMGIAMVAGNLLAGRFVWLCRSPRRAAVAGHVLATGALAGLCLLPALSPGLSIALLAALGICGTNYALLMAHARGLLPVHLVGRGVTFLNMISVGGVGVMQFASRPVHHATDALFAPAQSYALLFLFFLVPVVIGMILYLRTPEAADA